MFNSITNFLKEARLELKKVVWPNRKEVVSHTIIVLLAVFIAMLVIAAFDYGLTFIMRVLMGD